MEQLSLDGLKNLFTPIASIIQEHEKLAELTGGNFNVFKVLGLSNNEVRTHSAFISELLNPKGSHCQKDAFLKLFVEQFKIQDFDTKNTSVEVEKFIEFNNEEYSESGYIDILVSDKNNRAIIIENKINAGDQPRQLERYFSFGKQYYKFTLIYLTLNGKAPDDGSKGKLKDDDFNLMSYEKDILRWLEKCKEKVIDLPILRETISQYIYLIKLLTNQITDNAMEKEIVNQIISSPENLSTFLNIHKNDLLTGVRKELIKQLFIILDEIAKEQNLKWDPYGQIGEKENGFRFYQPNNSGKKYYLSFIFCGGYNNLLYGIENEDGEWLWNNKFEGEYNDWGVNFEPWLDIVDKTIKTKISEKVNILLKRLENLNKL